MCKKRCSETFVMISLCLGPMNQRPENIAHAIIMYQVKSQFKNVKHHLIHLFNREQNLGLNVPTEAIPSFTFPEVRCQRPSVVVRLRSFTDALSLPPQLSNEEHPGSMLLSMKWITCHCKWLPEHDLSCSCVVVAGAAVRDGVSAGGGAALCTAISIHGEAPLYTAYFIRPMSEARGHTQWAGWLGSMRASPAL